MNAPADRPVANQSSSPPPPSPPPQIVIDRLTASILADDRLRHLGATYLPQREPVLRLLEELRALMFPGFFGRRTLDRSSLPAHVDAVARQLSADLYEQIRCALRYWEALGQSSSILKSANNPAASAAIAPGIVDNIDAEAARITNEFLATLSEVRRLLALDVQAAYEGDPAALHTDETIFCYPGVTAIMVHRLAHELYKLNVPLLPRIMAEHAHSITGIDIHPGARIGESFFIDHGTGVVIGETTVIGKACKIYQGVTLGAKSFAKDARGRVVRGVKRHPTLGDRVTVYASATILGGDTWIGDDCIINGGVFLTRGVPAGHVVRAKAVELILRTNPEARGYEMDASGI